jgi:hypothetical protein
MKNKRYVLYKYPSLNLNPKKFNFYITMLLWTIPWMFSKYVFEYEDTKKDEYFPYWR